MIDWTQVVIAIIGSGGLVEIFNLLYFRPKLASAKADASIKTYEAEAKKHDYLEERVTAMERMFKLQGDELDKVRAELLSVKQENASIKAELAEMKAENSRLKSKVDYYEKIIKK